MILDTNALSALGQHDEGLLRVLRTSRRHSLPVIVLGEYRAGVLGSRLSREINVWLDEIEREFEILPVASSTAHHYAAIRHHLKTVGRPIPTNDLWIAALAREHGLAILSRDKHFDLVSDVTRLDW